MKQKLLITGGSGFIGYHLIEEAISRGYDVHVAIRASSAVEHLKQFDINFSQINLADEAAIRAELEAKRYDFIIHGAGTTKAPSQQEYDRVNAGFTANLATAAAGVNIPLKKFVFLSSLAAVGPLTPGVCSNQEDNFSPVTPYGKSKLKAEQLLGNIANLPFVILRPTAVYGPREKDILIMLRLFSRGFEPYIGNAPQHLSFLYVKDLAGVVMNALTSPVAGKAYNISDGRVYTRNALAENTSKILGKKTRRINVPVAAVKLFAAIAEGAGVLSGKTPALNRTKIRELTASWTCDITPAIKDLNFQPAYDLENGLAETIQWYKQHKWL